MAEPMSGVAGRMAALVLLAAALAWPQAVSASEEVWDLLKKPGHIILLRHANAPGFLEEPPGIDLRNCAIQRNLDENGRTQARRIGQMFRSHGIRQVRLLSSQWCRALETARLMGLGKVEELKLINYFNFDDLTRAQSEAEKTIAHMNTMRTRPLPVLVTHISNIKAVTGVTPDSGEMIVVRFEAGKLMVAGRIPPPK
jgi:phosphohistidine phosphatase SixA